MALLQQILKWSEELPAWQSDAIARLLTKQSLTQEDEEDLYALLKREQGIPDPQERIPKPLTAEQVPAPLNESVQVKLQAIKNLKHVNAIAESQHLHFGLSGMTVIYGDNGSGKSGYSRVLKRACRARDQAEEILPNVNLNIEQVGKPKATFEIVVNGTPQEVLWSYGQASPEELSSLAVFDTRCARAYLDDEDDFSYIPYGLDVFEGLAKLCKRLEDKLKREIAQNTPNLISFMSLQNNTVVGNVISSLSAKSSLSQINSLATLTKEELIQHQALEENLKEPNPKEKARHLRASSQRIRAIAQKTKGIGNLINQSTEQKLRTLANSFRDAEEASKLAAKNFKESGDLLPGTGGAAWRELFEAARKFAAESHPDKKFPNLEANDPCPLCQQVLAEGAERLLRFEAFVQQETEKVTQQRREALAIEYKAAINVAISLNLDDVTYSELEVLDSRLAADIKEFEERLVARQGSIKQAIISHEWENIAPMPVSPAERLQVLAEKLSDDANILEKASDSGKRVSLQQQFDELDTRIRLNEIKDAVIETIKQLINKERLEKCLKYTRTQSISRKASELAEKVISKELEDTLNQEFKALGVGALSVALHSRSSKGKALHKLKLNLPQSHNPSDILSEGEQRAIAIASFLAEIKLSGNQGGIIFDDPVSSLDHRRREQVAKRLAVEAAQRQVIVFTHDIYFLCLLAEEAKLAGVEIATQSLTRRAVGFGVATSELPFEAQKTKKRIGSLKQQHQAIDKLYRTGEEEEFKRQTREAYFYLRIAWERAVEEVLLHEVIIRFRKGVETQRLSSVIVEDEDYIKITAGMTKCSNYAHDKAYIGGVAIPEPDELLADIMELDNWRKAVEQRKSQIEKKRKSGSITL